MIEYKLILYDDPDLGYKECDSCGSTVPLYEFEIGCHKPDIKRYLCEICTCFLIANATKYPDQFHNVELFQALAVVGNLILDRVEIGRKPK